MIDQAYMAHRTAETNYEDCDTITLVVCGNVTMAMAMANNAGMASQ